MIRLASFPGPHAHFALATCGPGIFSHMRDASGRRTIFFALVRIAVALRQRRKAADIAQQSFEQFCPHTINQSTRLSVVKHAESLGTRL